MSDNRLMIVPTEHQIPCSSFTCYNLSSQRYYVGNPYSGGLYNYPVFCAECIQNLVDNIPAELSPEKAEIETRLRKQLTEQFNELLTEKVAELEKVAVAAASKMAAQKIAEAQSPFGMAPVDDLVPVEEVTTVPFRCLDCGDDFDTKAALDEHKATHNEAPAKNKGGRPPKGKA